MDHENELGTVQTDPVLLFCREHNKVRFSVGLESQIQIPVTGVLNHGAWPDVVNVKTPSHGWQSMMITGDHPTITDGYSNPMNTLGGIRRFTEIGNFGVWKHFLGSINLDTL